MDDCFCPDTRRRCGCLKNLLGVVAACLWHNYNYTLFNQYFGKLYRRNSVNGRLVWEPLQVGKLLHIVLQIIGFPSRLGLDLTTEFACWVGVWYSVVLKNQTQIYTIIRYQYHRIINFLLHTKLNLINHQVA